MLVPHRRNKDEGADKVSVSISQTVTMANVSYPAADLPATFIELPPSTQIALIRLATEFYTSLHSDLRTAWETSLTADEATKADQFREEGRKLGSAEMLAQFSDRLGSVQVMSIRIATLEETNKQLQEAAETEVTRRVTERLDGFRKDFEIQKLNEMGELREKVATLTAREEMMGTMATTVSLLEEKLESRENQLAELTAASTKSSHAIGKKGEREVYDMLVNGVCQVFQYATVLNMSGETHAADFHLTIQGKDGTPIKILIDSKKYTRPVGSSEIKKLHSDVDGDDEARAGMMISLNSPIHTARMFMVKYTDKGRPVLYLTLQDIEESRHQDVLCWAVYVLQSIAGKRDMEDRLRVIEELDGFLSGLDTSVKEIDVIIRQQNKLISSMRDMKVSLLRKIANFREARGGDGESIPEHDGIEHVDDSDEAVCDAIMKSTGKVCGRKVLIAGGRCGVHSARKSAAKEES